MQENLLGLVEQAGVVGAGGAGFPTHVKLKAQADTVIINGAECEPLLRVDQQLMARRAGELLEALDPQTVCISVGDNSYGHPASETLGRLIRQGCTVYRTDLHGTVELYLNQGDQHGIREKSAPEE